MTRSTRTLLSTTALLVAASLSRASLGASAVLHQPSPAETASPADQNDDKLYATGTKAMDEQRWADAVSAFDKVAAAKGKRADAALYWKAYSLNKLGRNEEAAATCGLLRGEFPSSWQNECIVLQVRSSVNTEQMAELARNRALAEVDASGLRVDLGSLETARVYGWRGPGSPRTTSEDDIKLLALTSVMRQDPARAIPMVRDILHSDKPLDVRRDALFILSRSKDPQAQALLAETAQNSKDPALQREALQAYALGRGKEAGPTLVNIYRSSSDVTVKRSALNSLFLAHDAPHLVDLARAEKDLNLKRDIVSQLALMKDPAATDYMLELLK